MTYSSNSSAGVRVILVSLSQGRVTADNDLTFEQIVRLLQHETQHVGGIVVLQVLAIERVDRRVIHDRNAHTAGGRTVVPQNRPCRLHQTFTVDCQIRLLVRDFDLDHVLRGLLLIRVLDA